MHISKDDNQIHKFIQSKFQFKDESKFNENFTEFILFVVDLLASQENQNKFIQNFDKIISLVINLDCL